MLGKLKVLLPSPEDLIVMKAIAHRPRDVADIEGILDAYPAVDVGYIRRWLEGFAEALDAPELLADANVLLRRIDAKVLAAPPQKHLATSRKMSSPKRASVRKSAAAPKKRRS